MSNVMKSLTSAEAAFVGAFLSGAMSNNQPRCIRVAEVRQSATAITSEHGEIADLEVICDKLEEELMFRNGNKCDSWGYKETGKKLANIIQQVRS